MSRYLPVLSIIGTLALLSLLKSLSLSLSLSHASLSSLITKQSTRRLSSMERSAWPKNLSSSGKRAIQELCGQNPKNLRDAFHAHSQTGDDPRQPLFAGDPVLHVLGSFSSNTQSLSSGAESYEVLQVPSNAFVSSEVSKGSESIMSPLESVKTLVQSLPVESFKTPVQSFPVESSKTSVRRLQRSPVESVETPVQRSPVSISWEQSVLEAATAIYEGRVDVASEILRRLSAVPNPRRSSRQRLREYMLSALKSRVSPVDYPPPAAESFTEDHLLSLRLSPLFECAFQAANGAIVEAASEQPSTNKIHVIAFDIGEKGTYDSLIVALSRLRAGNPFTLKITTLADSINGVERLGMFWNDGWSNFAAYWGVRVVFNIVRQKLSELSRNSLGCEPDEVLAVNLAFKLCRMPDESVSAENTREELLRRVKGLAPRVVTLVEQEMNGNTAPLPMRVGEALAYYGALLESSERVVSSLHRGMRGMMQIQKGLSRKLVNLVACEGRDRVDRCEVFEEWRARMRMAGFQLKPLGPHVAESLGDWLGFSSSDRRLTGKEENGGFCFGWRGQTLVVLSAWH